MNEASEKVDRSCVIGSGFGSGAGSFPSTRVSVSTAPAESLSVSGLSARDRNQRASGARDRGRDGSTTERISCGFCRKRLAQNKVFLEDLILVQRYGHKAIVVEVSSQLFSTKRLEKR